MRLDMNYEKTGKFLFQISKNREFIMKIEKLCDNACSVKCVHRIQRTYSHRKLDCGFSFHFERILSIYLEFFSPRKKNYFHLSMFSTFLKFSNNPLTFLFLYLLSIPRYTFNFNYISTFLVKSWQRILT